MACNIADRSRDCPASRRRPGCLISSLGRTDQGITMNTDTASCLNSAPHRLALRAALLAAVSALLLHGAPVAAASPAAAEDPAASAGMWDLSDLYPSPQAWADAYARTQAAAAALEGYKRHAGTKRHGHAYRARCHQRRQARNDAADGVCQSEVRRGSAHRGQSGAPSAGSVAANARGAENILVRTRGYRAGCRHGAALPGAERAAGAAL